MRKNIIFTATIINFLLVSSVSTSCNQNSGKNLETKSEALEEAVNNQEESSAETWLRGIFECHTGGDFCFPDEEKVFTERYYQFFIESLGIFEYPNFETEEEKLAAENEYKNKWKDIYPLDKEVWTPFGRGNGMGVGDTLENVIITPISHMEYTIIIEFGDSTVTTNYLRLIPSGNAFLIDYIEANLIE